VNYSKEIAVYFCKLSYRWLGGVVVGF